MSQVVGDSMVGAAANSLILLVMVDKPAGEEPSTADMHAERGVGKNYLSSLAQAK